MATSDGKAIDEAISNAPEHKAVRAPWVKLTRKLCRALGIAAPRSTQEAQELLDKYGDQIERAEVGINVMAQRLAAAEAKLAALRASGIDPDLALKQIAQKKA